MRIDHPEKIRFTSIKADGCLIHFYYDGDYYLVQTGNMCGEYTLTTSLYKGRNKCHMEIVSGCYGGFVGTSCGLIEGNGHSSDYLIRYLGHNTTLSHIDKSNFVQKLIGLGLLER